MVASGRTRRLVTSCVFCVKWVRWGVGGWVGGGDVNVHWTCTLMWGYATARSLQFIQLRDATLLHVLFKLHNYVMLCYCTFASIYTTTWCYVDWDGGVGGWVGGMLTFIGLAHLRDATLLHVLWRNLFFPIFTEKWRLWWGQRWIHLCDVVVSNMCGDVVSKLVHHWSCWKSWQSWWKQRRRQLLKELEKDVLMQKRYKNARRLTRPRPGIYTELYYIYNL